MAYCHQEETQFKAITFDDFLPFCDSNKRFASACLPYRLFTCELLLGLILFDSKSEK